MDGPVMVYEVMFRVELNTGRMYSVEVDPLLSMEHIKGPSMIAAEVPESKHNNIVIIIYGTCRYRCRDLPYYTLSTR